MYVNDPAGGAARTSARLLPDAGSAKPSVDRNFIEQAIVTAVTAGRDASEIPSTRATVDEGQGLSELAEKYGTTVQQLILLNKNHPNLFDLRDGDRIRVPLNRQVVEVREGDTVRELAATYGVTAAQIREANGLAKGERIEPGDRIALVPQSEYGLGRKSEVKAYIADIKTLEHQWNSLSEGERLEALTNAINERLAQRGIPPVSLQLGAAGANGVYDFTTHSIEINPSLLQKDGITSDELLDVADTLYHEGRHAEQWFDMARIQIAEGRPAADLGMPRAVIRAARDAPPIDLDSPRGRFANAMYESVYGAGAAHRANVLTILNGGSPTHEQYEDYRRLPEEADAWRVGGMVEQLW